MAVRLVPESENGWRQELLHSSTAGAERVKDGEDGAERIERVEQTVVVVMVYSATPTHLPVLYLSLALMLPLWFTGHMGMWLWLQFIPQFFICLFSSSFSCPDVTVLVHWALKNAHPKFPPSCLSLCSFLRCRLTVAVVLVTVTVFTVEK